MKHHTCRSQRTKVVDKRPVKGQIRRRRECLNCGLRFSTREILKEDLDKFMALQKLLAGEASKCELKQPIWAVISFHKVECKGLTFDEAARELEALQHRNVSGLVITTLDVAIRMIERRQEPQEVVAA